ncbi:beta-ketoacyl-ACP synthase III [Solimonas variicoloris]|uniref:beta-ketoacyl-ACP synthase III n=1 Tax=Solimonas variicoloris TaxID=254408 RepID=UPI0006887975|nr:beta-ketoacyl-ACP synthase III [Solimonas variicoloris]
MSARSSEKSAPAGVFITRIGTALPNAPVDNDRMEAVLGQVGGRPSRARALVLRSNGIQARHYVFDPESGRQTHSNAQLTAEAVRDLAGDGFAIDDIELLACGTSTPDQIAPNHGVMVHGELGSHPCEVVATAGICVSGVMSLKYAYMSVLAGLTRNAVATGSETASTFMRAWNFEAENEARVAALEKKPVIAFEKDFLRWMLSDGAGAMLLEDHARADGLSLRIDWIDQWSYAHELPTCMYAGAEKTAEGRLMGWRELGSMQAVADRSLLSLKQDVRLLEDGIRISSRRAFEAMIERRGLRVDEVDWYVPHYSSAHFADVMWEVMPDDWKIPRSRWFTNLRYRGNVGSASMYLLLDDLMRSQALRPGQRILCYVPESGRFSIAFVALTVVGP